MRFLAFLLAPVCLLAAEDAILTTGARIRAERHEAGEGTVKLYTRDGLIEIPSALVREFEAVETKGFVANPAGPPAPVPVVPALALERATPSQPVHPRQLVEDAAARHGIPPAFLHSVAQAESAYQPKAISPKGAIGIMQLMPATAAQLNADPHDPAQNVEAGARHLAALLEKYDGSSVRALAAYNAGEGAVAKYGGVPPYNETQLYVRKVIDNYKKLSAEKGTKAGRSAAE